MLFTQRAGLPSRAYQFNSPVRSSANFGSSAQLDFTTPLHQNRPGTALERPNPNKNRPMSTTTSKHSRSNTRAQSTKKRHTKNASFVGNRNMNNTFGPDMSKSGKLQTSFSFFNFFLCSFSRSKNI